MTRELIPAAVDGVDGVVQPGFREVAKALGCYAPDIHPGGAAFAVMHGDDILVDVWVGRAGPQAWARGTRAILMSATKGLAVGCMAMLADRGMVALPDAVATHWPEFAANGKDATTVAELLSHQAGLVTFPDAPSLLKPDGTGWDRHAEVVRCLELAPRMQLSNGFGYHGLTFSWLVGELFRRICCRTIGDFLREEVARPRGLELDVGTPRPTLKMVARPTLSHSLAASMATMAQNETTAHSQMAFTIGGRNVLTEIEEFCKRDTNLEIELPSTNATGTARALAAFYAALATTRQGPLISPGTLSTFTEEQVSGTDGVTGELVQWAAGFELGIGQPHLLQEHLGGPSYTFGHRGYGGQLGFAAPAHGLTVGLTRTRLVERDGLEEDLLRATYDCLATLGRP